MDRSLGPQLCTNAECRRNADSWTSICCSLVALYFFARSIIQANPDRWKHVSCCFVALSHSLPIESLELLAFPLCGTFSFLICTIQLATRPELQQQKSGQPKAAVASRSICCFCFIGLTPSFCPSGFSIFSNLSYKNLGSIRNGWLSLSAPGQRFDSSQRVGPLWGARDSCRRREQWTAVSILSLSLYIIYIYIII